LIYRKQRKQKLIAKRKIEKRIKEVLKIC